MDLGEKLDQISELCHRLKQDWVDTEPENPDLGIYLHFWRGDLVVVALQCPLDRDTALNAAQVGATGFNADTLAITFESYHSKLKESPVTGQPWKPKEMQYLAETDPEALAKRWVYSCLTTTIHDRGGGYFLRSEPYLMEGKEITWLKDENTTISSEEEDSYGAGFMFELLQKAMSEPTMEDLIAEKAETDPTARMMSALMTNQEHRLFHSDMATLRLMEERDLVTMVVFGADPGSERENLLRSRFGEPDPE